MHEMLSTRENLTRYFRYLVLKYDRDKYPRFEGSYQFNLTEGGLCHAYRVTVSRGEAQFAEGVHPCPVLTIESPVDVWLAVSGGRRSGTVAYLLGLYRIRGRLRELRKFSQIFGKKFTPLVMRESEEGDHRRSKPTAAERRRFTRALVIAGSSRGLKGYTGFYLDHFVRGMRDAGGEVEVIDLSRSDLAVAPCRGCFRCWLRDGAPCVIEDDGGWIIRRINESPLVVYALPLYADSAPAKVKALLDRQFINLRPFFVPAGRLTRHPLRHPATRSLALLAVCGFPEAEHFAPLVQQFKDFAHNGCYDFAAAILRPGGQYFYEDPTCIGPLRKIAAALEEAGRELMLRGRVSRGLLKAIAGDYGISRVVWREQSNMYWYLKSGGGKEAEGHAVE